MAQRDRIMVELPAPLRDRFNSSNFRREARTDAEGLRFALRFALDADGRDRPQSPLPKKSAAKRKIRRRSN